MRAVRPRSAVELLSPSAPVVVVPSIVLVSSVVSAASGAVTRGGRAMVAVVVDGPVVGAVALGSPAVPPVSTSAVPAAPTIVPTALTSLATSVASDAPHVAEIRSVVLAAERGRQSPHVSEPFDTSASLDALRVAHISSRTFITTLLFADELAELAADDAGGSSSRK